MIPTTSDVYSLARRLAGEESDTSFEADIFNDAYLQKHLKSAVSDMFSALRHAEARTLFRRVYLLVPARQFYLDFRTFDVPDLKEIETIRARAVGSSGDITGIAATTVWTITSAAHGLTAQDQVFIQGVTVEADEYINQEWPVANPLTNTFELLGAPLRTRGGTYSSGGKWVKTTSDWSFPFDHVTEARTVHDVSTHRAAYEFRGDHAMITPHNAERLIEIAYQINPDRLVGGANAASDLRIDESLQFLAEMTAAYALASRGADSSATFWFKAACGAKSPGEIDLRNPGGHLGSLTQEHAKTREAIERKRFRPHRRGYPGRHGSPWV